MFLRRLLTVAVGCAALSLAFVPGRGLAAADGPSETGTFTLFKFEQEVGEERYEIRQAGEVSTLTSTFAFTDRGTPVRLATTLQFRPGLAPVRFAIKGETARISLIDAEVTIGRDQADVRSGSTARSVPLAPGVFTLAGYAPPSMQMELMRYWESNGRPTSIPLLPRGNARIEPRGRDVVTIDGQPVSLDRYSVGGVIWGRESLWCDASGRLAALVSVDAEFDHFEAVRPELAAALPQFVARAAEDGMAAMAETAAAETPPASRVLAVKGGRIIDTVGRRPLFDGTVVIEDGRIAAVGPSSQVAVPDGATVVDARGKTVIPGLWDMHAHFEQVEWGPIYLAAGVTTVRDVGNELEFVTAIRNAIASGKGLGPRLLLAGIIDGEGAQGIGVARAATAEDGRRLVARYHDAGFDQIKIYSSISPGVLRAITGEAHRLGMTVTGHVPNGMTALDAVGAGLDQINHEQYLHAVMRPDASRAIAEFRRHGTVIDPTLALFELLGRPLSEPIAAFEPGFLKVAPELAGPLSGFGLPAEQAERQRARFEEGLAMVAALHRAGIPIVAGTDQAVPGHSLHRELELYVRAGFSPLDALRAATVVSARAMKKDGDGGTIEKGKRGDLVVLDANPLDDIRNTRRIHRVITDGRVFNPAPLWRSVNFQP